MIFSFLFQNWQIPVVTVPNCVGKFRLQNFIIAKVGIQSQFVDTLHQESRTISNLLRPWPWPCCCSRPPPAWPSAPCSAAQASSCCSPSSAHFLQQQKTDICREDKIKATQNRVHCSYVHVCFVQVTTCGAPDAPRCAHFSTVISPS